MMNRFQTICLRPDRLQFLTDDGAAVVLFLASAVCLGGEGHGLKPFFLLAAVLLGVYLLLSFWALRRKLFILTPEMLVYDRGIFFRRADYIELYRVVDFHESQSLLQQIFGLKTVVVYSGDRTTPKLFIPGVHHRDDLISELRARVEYNKTRRGVYEITNRC